MCGIRSLSNGARVAQVVDKRQCLHVLVHVQSRHTFIHLDIGGGASCQVADSCELDEST